MYRCKCGKQLFPKGYKAACEDCGRGYMKASNGNLVQVSRPTKRPPDVKPRTAQEEIDLLSDLLAANHAKLRKALRG